MRVELTRFRVLPGKSERVDEWIQMLNDRMSETLATLEREQMYVEVIFRERVGDDEYLSWFSVQGETGEAVATSLHEVDHLHLEYWRECIDPTYGAHDAVPQVVMVPEALAAAIRWADPAGSAVKWTGQPTWRRPPAASTQAAEESRPNTPER